MKRLKGRLKSAIRFLADLAIVAGPPLLRDAIGLAGGAMVAYGAHLIYAPAGWIVGGLSLVATAWLLARGAR